MGLGGLTVLSIKVYWIELIIIFHQSLEKKENNGYNYLQT